MICICGHEDIEHDPQGRGACVVGVMDLQPQEDGTLRKEPIWCQCVSFREAVIQ